MKLARSSMNRLLDAHDCTKAHAREIVNKTASDLEESILEYRKAHEEEEEALDKEWENLISSI